MNKKIKILIALLLLLTSCSKIPVIDSKDELVRNIEVDVSKEKNTTLESDLKIEQNNEIVSEVENIQLGDLDLEEEKKIEDSAIEAKKESSNIEIKELSKENIKNNRYDNAIKNFVNKSTLKNSNIGIYVIDLKSGETLGEYRGEKAVIPASVMKVVTSATAISILGEDERFETKVYYDGKIENGTLLGDIYIVGGGDPTLGSDGFKNRDRELFLKDWTKEIKSLGIEKIQGDIVVKDDIFGYEGVMGKWLWEDFGTSYAPGTYGISIFDNLYTLYLSSNNDSVKVLGTKPEVKGLKFENNLKISPNGRKKFYVRGIPFENERILKGEIPANLEKISIKSDIPDPAKFLGEYFKEFLSKNGIQVQGKIKTSRLSNKRAKNPKLITITYSPKVSEIVKVLLDRSDNHYTETLYQHLKLRDIDIDKFWKEKGIDTGALVMWDGSGLSRGDYVSTELLAKILEYMYFSYPNYVELLARGGIDGTVADFMGKEVFQGEARVKSGSMSGIQSYAGYLKKGDRNLAFAITVNHWNGKRATLKRDMEKLLNSFFDEKN